MAFHQNLHRTFHRTLLAATALTAIAAQPAAADVTLSGNLTSQVNLENAQTGGGIVTIQSGTVLTGLGSTTLSVGTQTFGPFAIFSPSGVTAGAGVPKWTITNSGFVSGDLTNALNAAANPSTGGIYVGDGAAITNQAGATVAGDRFGIVAGSFLNSANFAAPTSSITNAGTVISYFTPASGFSAAGGGNAILLLRGGTITNTGTVITGASLIVSSGGASVSGLGNGGGLAISGASGTINNSGIVFGALTLGAGGTITNTGTVSTTPLATALIAQAAVSTGQQILLQGPTGLISAGTGAGTVINSGTITTTSAIGVRTANLINNAGGVITSTGTFSDSTDSLLQGDGVLIAGGEDPVTHAVISNSLSNAGTITGATGGVKFGHISTFNAQGQLLNESEAGFGSVFNDTTGVITGSVVGIAAGDRGLTSLDNRGKIQGLHGVGLVVDGGGDGPFTNSGQILGGPEAFTAFNGVTTVANLASVGDSINNATTPFSTIPFTAGSLITYNDGGQASGILITNAAGGVVSAGYAGILANDANFSATSPQSGALPASALTIANSGTIASTTSGPGIMFLGSATINNNAGGVITGTTFQTAVGMENLAIWIVQNGIVNNAGTINGHVKIEGTAAFTNSGTLNLAAGSPFGTSTINGSFTNTSTGRIVVKANEFNQSDKIMVTGRATLQGGSVSVVAPDGQWDVNHTYTILTANGGVSGTFTGADINLAFLAPLLSYDANNVTLTVTRQTQAIQQQVVQQTTAQQTSTSSRQVAASINARVDQAISAVFVSLPTGGAPSGGSGGSGGGSGGPGSGPGPQAFGALSGLSAGDDASGGWGTWATATPTFTSQKTVLPGQTSPQGINGTSLSFMAGVDKVLGSRLVAGGFVSYEDSFFDIGASSGHRSGKGPVLGVYAGAILTDWAYASLQVNNAFLSNHLSEGTFGSAPVKGAFDSSRFMLSSTVTAYQVWDDVKISAKAGYSFTHETFDTYTASDASSVSPSVSRLQRVSAGTEIAGVSDTWVPYISGTYEWDIDTTGSGDRAGGIIGAGLRFINGPFTFDFYGSIQVGRFQERSSSFGLNMRYAF